MRKVNPHTLNLTFLSFLTIVLGLLLPAGAEAQFSRDSIYCRTNPDAYGCPPPVRIQVVEPDRQSHPESASDLASELIAIRNARIRAEESAARARWLDAQTRALEAPQAPRAPQASAAATPANLQALVLAFYASHPDLLDYLPGMQRWALVVAPAPEADPSRYLEALYLLAKTQPGEGAGQEDPSPDDEP